MDILTKLILPVHEHGICFHLFVSSSIFYNFLSIVFPWLNVFLGILFFDAIVNGTVFLNILIACYCWVKMQLISKY